MKTIIKHLFGAILFILSTAVVYLFFAVLLSLIPVNRNTASIKDVEIYIRSNGVHLEIVLPIKTPYKDWSEELFIDRRIASGVRYISFGWGDKNFYYNTPEWSDLTFFTAFKAMLMKSESAMHVDYHSSLRTGKLCKRIPVSSGQYLEIVHFVEAAFRRDSNHELILIDDLHYSPFDCFYEAWGSYNLFFTCNTWTNRCLKRAGLKASLWTPFDRGILFHYRK